MSDSRPSRPELAELLTSVPIGVPTPSELEAEEARLVPWLEAKIAELPEARRQATRLRQRRWWRAGGVGVVAVAALTLMAFRLVGNRAQEEAQFSASSASVTTATPEPGAVLVEGELESGPLRVLLGSRLGLAAGVRTREHQSAKLVADEGYTIQLAEKSALRLAEAESTAVTALELALGSVELNVPKLAEGKSLEVRVSGTSIIVHGTRFRVTVVDAEHQAVCTELFEGKIEIRQGGKTLAFLSPGESFGCGKKPNSGERVLRATNTAMRGKISTLADENALLGQALLMERREDWRAAGERYRLLLERYPNSQFLPEARAGLARAERSLGR